MFHALGTHARWWACCHHILGTHRSHPRHVPHARDGAHPSCTSDASGACSTCQMVGMLPPHPGNMQKLSRTCSTHPGCVARARDMFSMFPGCGGGMPTMWHVSPAHGTCPRRVRHILCTERVLDTRLGCALS